MAVEQEQTIIQEQQDVVLAGEVEQKRLQKIKVVLLATGVVPLIVQIVRGEESILMLPVVVVVLDLQKKL